MSRTSTIFTKVRGLTPLIDLQTRARVKFRQSDVGIEGHQTHRDLDEDRTRNIPFLHENECD